MNSFCDLRSGRWHGDVILHQFELKNSTEVASFWSEVQSLTKLRHENLLLFMGIATERPHYDLTCHPASRYVIVNSAPRGLSVASVRSQAPKNGKPERIGYTQTHTQLPSKTCYLFIKLTRPSLMQYTILIGCDVQ